MTQVSYENNEIFMTKKINNTNVLTGHVEPTFTDGEFSAVISDEFDYWKEKFFNNIDDAELWVMSQFVKLSKTLD